MKLYKKIRDRIDKLKCKLLGHYNFDATITTTTTFMDRTEKKERKGQYCLRCAEFQKQSS